MAAAATVIALVPATAARAAELTTPLITDIRPFLQHKYPFVEATPTPMWPVIKAVKSPDRRIGLSRQAFAEASSSPYAGTGTPPPATSRGRAAKPAAQQGQPSPGNDEDNGEVK